MVTSAELPTEVKAEAGSRMAYLQSRLIELAPQATRIEKELKEVKDELKALIRKASETAQRFELAPLDDEPPLTLVRSATLRLDEKALQQGDVQTFLKWSKVRESWTLAFKKAGS